MSAASVWLDDFFEHYYRRRPVNATFIGIHDYDDQLPDYSNDGLQGLAREMDELLDQFEDVRVRGSAVNNAERHDLLLAGNYLRQQLWELESDHFQRGNPCVYTGEAIFGVISLLLRDFAPLADRLQSASARMRRIPELLAQGREQVTSAPRAWIDRAVDECLGAEALLTHGVEWLAPHSRDERDFRGAAELARVWFEEHRAYLERMPVVDDPYAVGVGRAALDSLLRDGHLLDDDASNIQRDAERRLIDERAELVEGAQRLSGTDDWAGLLAGLQELHPSPADYLAAFPAMWEGARAEAIERDLVTWPDFPIVFEPIPEWARAAAPHLYFLYYRSPAPFDAGLVQRYLVLPVTGDMSSDEQQTVLRSVNGAQIKLNHVVHHAGLGHHVQNWNAFRSPSRVGQMAGVDCASRIALFSAGTLVEGWSCYAVDLMDEVGFLSPLESLSMHQSRMRMAARTLVDIGLHTHQMTLDNAATFYVREVGMSPAAAHAEAVKNSMNPGAAMMYLSGTDAIHRLRRDIEAIEGTNFSLRAFHNELLSYGSIPISLIAREMHAVRNGQLA